MVKEISYKEWTCDLCGNVECENDKKSIPENWICMSFGSTSYHLCPECNARIKFAMNQIEKKEQ